MYVSATDPVKFEVLQANSTSITLGQFNHDEVFEMFSKKLVPTIDCVVTDGTFNGEHANTVLL